MAKKIKITDNFAVCLILLAIIVGTTTAVLDHKVAKAMAKYDKEITYTKEYKHE